MKCVTWVGRGGPIRAECVDYFFPKLVKIQCDSGLGLPIETVPALVMQLADSMCSLLSVTL